MKLLATFLFTLQISTLSFAQFEWVGDIGFSVSPNGLYKTKNSHFILSFSGAEDGFNVFDSTGTIVFGVIDPYDYLDTASSYRTIQLMIEMPDSSFVMYSFRGYCDPGFGGYIWEELVKYDKDWNETTLVPYLSIGAEHGAALSDGSFVLLASNGAIEMREANGNLLWSDHFPQDFYSLAVTSSDTLLLASDEGLLVLDKEGTLDTIYENYIFSQIELTDQGNLIGYRADSIFLLSPDFDLLEVIDFDGDNVRDFETEGSLVAFVTETNHVYIINSLLSIQHDFMLQPAGYSKFISIADDGIIVAGSESSGGPGWMKGNGAPFIKKYSFDGIAPDNSRDAGVVNVEQIKEPYVVHDHPRYFTVTYDTLKMTVQNYGDETINSLKLNTSFSFIGLDPYCTGLIQNYAKTYENLSLAPGASMELYWTDFKVRTWYNPAGQPLEICIWTSLPDTKMDPVNSNDIFCSGFLVDDEEVISQTVLSIYPNPSSAVCSMRYQLPAVSQGKVHIFDSLGRQVAEYPLTGGGGFINLPAFPSGIYFAALSVDGMLMIQEKFVRM